ncbi:MAG TPA: GDP-mannose 4,6-dehydratase [Rhabdochlamydiaceae bacterium]|nr:GDP-mannose 4,6-dehydratase [Rhabdochlamydiaceae bacterium]
MKSKTIVPWLTFLIIGLFANLSADIAIAPKKALIFGITGQDGAYLAELLLDKNYEVHGVKRRSSTRNTERLEQICEKAEKENKRFFLHYGDLCDNINISNLIQTIKPDEVYNLAAQSHVKVSFEMPLYTVDVDGMGALRILEAIRQIGHEKQMKYYQASSSEMFGKVQETPQTEMTNFHPRSPYGVAKVLAYWITVNYREAYGVFACNGILFNHESPLREETFVTRKIALAACRYKCGYNQVLQLGNLDAKRDWGYAKDYVEAIWLMLQQDKPEDYVIATGETHSVREFVELAYKELGIDIEWKGEGINEQGIDKKTGRTIVKVNPEFYRPAEVDFLLGNAEKARQNLKWEPKTHFRDLLKIMIESDLKKTEDESRREI